MTDPRMAAADRFRLEQLGMRAATIREISRLFQERWDPSDLDGSVAAIVGATSRMVMRDYRQGSERAAEFVREVRDIAGSRATQLAVAGEPDARRVQRTVAKSALTSAATAFRQGVPQQEALRRSAVAASGSAGRLSLEGGRRTVVESAELAREAGHSRGWKRETGAEPCAFCAMLATRGAVYHSEETARGGRGNFRGDGTGPDFEVHDHCACEPVEVFEREPLRPREQEFWELYKEATRDVRGTKPAQSAFRAAYRQAYGRT